MTNTLSFALSPVGLAARLVSCCLLVSLVGCTTLKPAVQVPEYADGSALAPVWNSFAGRPARDEHVLLNEGMRALDVRLRAIDSAVSSIDLQTFLWMFDDAGTAVAQHLLAAAERGVRVRILVDDTFLIGRDASLLQFANHERIEFRIFNPYQQRGADFVSTEAINMLELKRLDHRMHNKAMIVDGQIGIAGGRNLADEYFGLHHEGNFRDLELLLRGPIIGELEGAFDGYWNSPWSLPIADIANPRIRKAEPAANPVSVHMEYAEAELAKYWAALFSESTVGSATLVVDRAPEENPAEASEAPVQLADFLVDLFDSAEEEIVILSAYLIPTPRLEGAVSRALKRGVRIRMLTNSLRSNNHITAHSAYRNHILSLVENGVELYEVRADASDRKLYMLSPADEKQLALHAKVLLVDADRVFVGSANLDPRSLRINTELGLLIQSASLNAQLRRAFTPDFAAGNAWSLELAAGDQLIWRSGDVELQAQPADSFMQRIEDWFFSTLPIESEL
jgi:putative cardiolipin synthase